MGIVITILFIIALIKDYKTTFVVFMVFSIWIKHFTFAMPFKLGFYSTISFVALVLFFIQDKKRDLNRYIKYPLLVPSLLIVLSYVLSEIYAIDEHHYPTMFFSLFPYLGNVFIFWALFQKYPKSIVKLVWKSSIILASIVAVYALIETLSSSNFFVSLMIKLKLYTYDTIIKDERFGIHRSQSIFSMHTTNGVACTLLGFTILWLKRKYHFMKEEPYFIYGLILLLIAVNFMTGSRATIIGMIICLIGLLNIKQLRMEKVIFGIIAISFVVILLDSYFGQVFDSIIDTNKAGGSNSSMRSNQLETSYYFMKKSFFLGNGNGYVWRYVQEYYRIDILGAESMWFPEMIDRGLLGCITLFIYICYCAYYVWRHCDKSLLFFVAGITVMNTLSSLPNFYFTYLFIYILVFSNIKWSRHEIENKIIQRLGLV